jgi:hypothetical protein
MSITLGTYTTLSSSSNKALLVYKATPTSNTIIVAKPNLYKGNYNKLNK